jgi:hypothetical protein
LIDIASIKTEQDLADILDQVGFISDRPDPIRFTGDNRFPSRCIFWKVNPVIAYPVGVLVNDSELQAYYYDFCNDWFTYFDSCQGNISEEELRLLIINTGVPKLILLEADTDWNAIFASLGLQVAPDEVSPEKAVQYRKACIVDAARNSFPRDVKVVLQNIGSIAIFVYDQDTRQFIPSETSLPRLIAETRLQETIRSAAGVV